MHVRGLLPVLLLLLVPLPAVATHLDVYVIAPGKPVGTPIVTLEEPAEPLRFELNPTSFAASQYTPALSGTVQGIVVKLANVTKGVEIQVQLASPSAQGVADGVWRGQLSTGDTRLAKALYTVTATVVSGSGSHLLADGATRRLDVRSTADAAAPTIAVSGATADNKVRLGFGDDLAVLIDDATPSSGIAKVTYTLTGVTGTLPLDFPYIIDFDTFADGSQTLTVNATDRAGRTAGKVFTVIADAKPPTAVVTLPDRLFVGIPTAIAVQASDVSPYNVTFTQGNGTTSSKGLGPSQLHTFNLLANKTGIVSFTIRLYDILGNSAEKSYAIEASILQTDSTIKELATSVATPVVGEALSLRVVLEQAPGFLPLDLNVTITGAITAARNTTVPASGPATLLVPMRLSVGKHTLSVKVAAPANVQETDASDQTRNLTFEVYFARVVEGNSTYYIRASEFGVPAEAVRSDGKVMPLRLVQDGASVVYQFTDSGRNVTWDPSPSTSTQSTSGSETGKAKGSPGLATPLLVAAVLALALRRRLGAA